MHNIGGTNFWSGGESDRFGGRNIQPCRCEGWGNRIVVDGAAGREEKWRDTAGRLHRGGDLPAKVYPNEYDMWYQHGKLHRSGDLPAVILADGTQMWYRNGELHRGGDMPAVTSEDGRKEWWWDGKLHRSGDLPAVILANGTQEWWWHGVLHRGGDMPAVTYDDGRKEWWWHNKTHRVSGPAVTGPDGAQEWWFRGIKTEHPDLCEQAYTPARTEEGKEQLVLLCLHDDPVVAAVAAHNPSCPEEGVVAYYLKH